MFTLAVDVMGGDLGPRVALVACKKFLRLHPSVHLVVTVTHPFVAQATQILGHSARVRILGCDSQIEMTDKPARALRSGMSSTMAAAMVEVKEKRAHAVLSAGNTGALMVLSRALLGMLPGVDRPALATILPTRDKPLLLLDLGANLDTKAEQLVQFAALGRGWVAVQHPELNNIRVGLLNVGREPGKGTDEIRAADERLRALLGESYSGFCEGDDLYRGELDVMVTDGFAGNVMLKSSESLIEWLLELLHHEFKQHWYRRWFYALWIGAIRRIVYRLSPTHNSGALLLGLDGVVVKTHGKSDGKMFRQALVYVLEQLQQHDGEKLSQQMSILQRTVSKAQNE